MISLKEWLSAEKNISLLLNVLGLAIVLMWLFWYFGIGLKTVQVEEPETMAPPINIDKSAYDLTDKYLNSIKKFTLPEFSYDNSEPFREYR